MSLFGPRLLFAIHIVHFAAKTTMIGWFLCGDRSLIGEDIFCSVQNDASHHRHHFGLFPPAPAASLLSRAETYSHPCLLINTETSSKANSCWQRCPGPMLTPSPAHYGADFLRPLPPTLPRHISLLCKPKAFSLGYTVSLSWGTNREARGNSVAQRVERN